MISSQLAVPVATDYALARWQEILAQDAPWWARTSGMGYRLRLRELYELAQAREEGSIAQRPVELLTTEAFAVMFKKDGHDRPYCERRFPGLAKEVQRLVKRPKDKGERTQQFLPGGQAASAIKAAMDLLRQSELVRRLTDDLVSVLEKPGSVKTLGEIDELVELLDAELAFDGFSAPWRRSVASEVAKALEEDTDPKPAFALILTRHKEDAPRAFEALVPINSIVRPDQVAISLSELSGEEAEEMVTNEWTAEPQLSAVSFSEGAAHFHIGAEQEDGDPARDIDGAAGLVRDWLSRRMDLWRLQGGAVTVGPQMLVYDHERKRCSAFPTEMPLRLEPTGLRSLASKLDRQSVSASREGPGGGRLLDVFVQLAQARTASAGASLSDLWMVIEAMFAGVAEDPRHEAGVVLGGIARWHLVSAKLNWLADRLDGTSAAGDYDSDAGTEAEWVAKVLEERLEQVLEELRTTDPLAWRRVVEVHAWKEPTGLLNELDNVAEWVERISARAYLVRNFVVHQARPSRAPALHVTLPVFASLVQMAMSFVSKFPESVRSPLAPATLAAMQAIQLAHEFDEHTTPSFQRLIAEIERFAPPA